MKPFRTNQIYISEKADFYAHIFVKAKCNGTEANMTKDQLIDAELIDKWEHEYPALLEAYERNCELKQANRKAYAENEAAVVEAIGKI